MIKINTLRRIQAKEDYTVVELCITYRCQLVCNFCFIQMLKRHLNTFTFPDLDLDKTLDFLKAFHEKTHKVLRIKILGGEPTMHKCLYDFCKKAADLEYVKDIVVFSNLMSEMQTYAKLLQIDKIKLDLSYHMTNDLEFNQQFFDNLKILFKQYYKNDKRINITMMAEKDKSGTLTSFFKANNITKNLQKIYDFYLDYRLIKNVYVEKNHYSYYTDDELKQLKSLIQNETLEYVVEYDNDTKIYTQTQYDLEFENNLLKEYKGCKCLGGTQFMYIIPTGDVCACPYESQNNNFVCSIYDTKNFNFIDKYMICQMKCKICEHDITRIIDT